MKEYNILFWYTQGGTTTIEAKSPEEAKEKIVQELNDYGLERIEVDPTHREWEVLEVK